MLALPSREYYLKTSSKADLNAYHKYMTQIAVILGADADLADEEMQEVLDFEITLANVRSLTLYDWNICFFFINKNHICYAGLIIRNRSARHQHCI